MRVRDEVYLNGELKTRTESNQLQLEGLAKGHYLAAVRSVYASGYSDMATVEFDVLHSGVGMTENDNLAIDVKDRTLTVKGGCDSAEMISVSGITTRLEGSASFDLSAMQPGIYMLRVRKGDNMIVKKVNLR